MFLSIGLAYRQDCFAIAAAVGVALKNAAHGEEQLVGECVAMSIVVAQALGSGVSFAQVKQQQVTGSNTNYLQLEN